MKGATTTVRRWQQPPDRRRLLTASLRCQQRVRHGRRREGARRRCPLARSAGPRRSHSGAAARHTCAQTSSRASATRASSAGTASASAERVRRCTRACRTTTDLSSSSRARASQSASRGPELGPELQWTRLTTRRPGRGSSATSSGVGRMCKVRRTKGDATRADEVDVLTGCGRSCTVPRSPWTSPRRSARNRERDREQAYGVPRAERSPWSRCQPPAV